VALGAAALLGFALAGGITPAGAGLAAGAAALFASRESLSALTKPALARRNGEGRLIVWGLALIALAAVLALPALAARPPLLAAGAGAVGALLVHARARRDNADRSAPVEATAMLAIFALAPLIDEAQRGGVTGVEVVAAATLAITLAAGISYAKMRIRQLALREPRRIDLLRTGLPPVLWHAAAAGAVAALALALHATPLFAAVPLIALLRCAARAWRPKREKMAAVGRQETLLLALEFLMVLSLAGRPPV